MTMAADSREVFGRGFSRAIQDSSTPSDRARQGASPLVMSHEIRRREGLSNRADKIYHQVLDIHFILFKPLNNLMKLITNSHASIYNAQSSYFIASASRAAVSVCLKALLTHP